VKSAERSLTEEYLDYLDSVRGLSIATRLAYSHDLSTWEEFLATQNSDPLRASRREASAFLTRLGKSGLATSSVNRTLSCLRGFYRFLQKTGRKSEHPLTGIRGLKRSRHLPAFLFEKEVLKILEAPPAQGFQGLRDRTLFEFLYATGCRVSELCSLRLDDVQLLPDGQEGGQIRVLGKGRKSRTIFLTASAVAALKAYLPERSARLDLLDPQAAVKLFLNARGQALGVRGVAKILARALRVSALTKHVSPHTFRHTFATHLLNEGMDVRVVQELLGHSRLETTQIYTHLDLDRLRDVVRHSHPHG
jgi:site-specific recombinase XerD